jgi:hypothetical protein
MSTEDMAEALALEPVEQHVWGGVRDGLSFGLRSAPKLVFGPALDATLWCEHSVPLRLGILAQTRPPWGHDPLVQLPEIAIEDRRLESKLSLRAREAVIARELVVEPANLLVTMLDDGVLSIDDQCVWITLDRRPDARELRAIADRMTDLSTRLSRARADWEASFETAMAPVWARIAAGTGMKWNADASTLSGELRGASVEARVDGEPGVLFTEVYVEWDTLDRGLSITRSARRGQPCDPPPPVTEVAALTAAFERAFEGGEPELPAGVLHGALSIASTGASLTIDDDGLVARIDEVADADETIGPLVHGALEITKALLGPLDPVALYR